MTTEPPADQGTRVCYRHTGRETRLSCSECGRPVCPDCSIDAAVGQKCPECVGRGGRQTVIDARRAMSPWSSALPPVTKVILTVTVAVFVLGWVPGFGEGIEQLLVHASRLVEAGQWWRVFTAALVHASITHILFNMWALYALGPEIERGVGSGPFLALYLAAAGMGGAAAQFLTSGNFIAVGASGAIFGLFGVWLDLAFRRRNTAWGRAMLSRFGVMIAINAALPLLIPSISWQAHLGGFLAGILIGEIWYRLSGGNAERTRTMVAAGVAIVAVVLVMVG